MMRRRSRGLPLAVLLTFLPAWPPGPMTPPDGATRMAQLWEEPYDIAARDLYYGPGGKELEPRPDVEYRVVGLDTRGHSHGYDVKDPEGRKWDVKIGDEAQTDLVVSRILWAIGYRQPVTYYVPAWRMTGAPGKKPEPARFRLSSDHKVTGEWSWTDNPFTDTRPFRGLVVANLVLNNWDLTTSNNRTYRTKRSGGSQTWYVVQDVGGSLGRTKWPVGTRNNLPDFESQGLIRDVHNGKVSFDYRARHQGLVDRVTPGDVVWTCRLLDRLSEKQWDDAFRAAGYPPDMRDRFVRKIRQKIREGLALAREEPEKGDRS